MPCDTQFVKLRLKLRQTSLFLLFCNLAATRSSELSAWDPAKHAIPAEQSRVSFDGSFA